MRAKDPQQLTSAKEICEQYHIPFDPTSRVLQIMTQYELLHAEQGPKGGYKILRDLNTVSMLDLSDMIIGPIAIANCFLGDHSSCEINHSCHIISPMLKINEGIKDLFARMTIAELLSAKHSEEQHIRDKKTLEESKV